MLVQLYGETPVDRHSELRRNPAAFCAAAHGSEKPMDAGTSPA